MRRLPAEPELSLLGLFLVCLLLSVVVAGAFVVYGDVPRPAQARMVILPAQVIAEARKPNCPAKAAAARTPCLPEWKGTKLVARR